MKTEIIKINPETPEPEKISRCAKILRAGGLVAFPTETVYGLAANKSDKQAVKRLLEVKKDREGKPFSLHIADKGQVENYGVNLKPAVYKLIDKFWPGPLTIIVPGKEQACLPARQATVGIRMPRNAVALKLIAEAGVPVVAPSANFSGNPPPLTADEVLRDLDGLIEAVIDAGKVELGVESTVVDLTIAPPQILRKGAIPEKDIMAAINKKTVLFVCTGNSCRSVMAGALLKKMTAGRDDLEVQDAGVMAMTGMGPTQDTVDLLRGEGIDVSSHRATMLTDMMIKRSDIILVMEKLHEERILQRVPSAKDRLYLLKEFAGMVEAGHSADLSISDPIGKSSQVYDDCFNTIKEAIKKITELI
jgi:tRNA threonylcarbamoyl adenosine modification protein (Sua5/YciO/YrdC/YwlC family)